MIIYLCLFAALVSGTTIGLSLGKFVDKLNQNNSKRINQRGPTAME